MGPEKKGELWQVLCYRPGDETRGTGSGGAEEKHGSAFSLLGAGEALGEQGVPAAVECCGEAVGRGACLFVFNQWRKALVCSKGWERLQKKETQSTIKHKVVFFSDFHRSCWVLFPVQPCSMACV